MAVETFRFIEYSDESKFTKVDNRIELKQYTDDLLFYTSFDSTFNAIYSEGDTSATIVGTTTNENNGVFGQFGYLQNGSVEWNANNFTDLTDEGCIKFRVRPGFNNAPGRQDFVRTINPIITAVPDVDTNEHRFGGASLNLTGNEEKRVEYNVDNVASMLQTGTIDFFVKFDYTGTPSNNIGLVDIKNAADNNNRILITHETDGKLYFRIYDQTGVEVVNVNFAWAADSDWHNIELNFDLNSGATRAFMDGTQYGITDTSTATKTNVTGFINIGSTSGYISEFYIEDIAFFSTVQNVVNFVPRTIAHTGSETDLVFYASYDTSIDLDNGAGTLTYSSTTPSSNNYEFKLTVAGVLFGGADTAVSLDSDDTISDVRNKIEVAIVGSGAVTELLPAGNIRIKATTDGATILIEAPDTGRDLVTLLDGVNDAELPNAPGTDVNIFDCYNGSNNNNRITLTHDTDSHLVLKMYDSSGTIKANQDMGIWNDEDTTWYAFEFNWNQTIAQFFIDGTLFYVLQTNFQRGGELPLKISSGTADYYKFDELIVYKEYQHSQNYTVETLVLSPYAADDPFIDVHFGTGFKEAEVADLNLICSGGCNFVVKLANTWYYYLSGAWRQSDGSYSQSINPATMETKFAGLFFDENQELIIRIYFHSDGQTLIWLDEISIITEVAEEIAAVITGTIDLTSPVDLSTNYNVTIATDQGTQEVDLSAGAGNAAAVTLDEIKNAIDNASIPGLAAAVDDGTGHLVLKSENTGTSSYVSISNGSTNDALSIVWGYEATDSGEEPTGIYFDYSGITNWIRAKLGAPIAPVELTDEQIEAGIGSAVYWYNYYKNSKEKFITINLSGNPTTGWEIPTEVGGEDNIIEIIMKPRFPYTYYIGREDLLGNLYMQYFFHKFRSGYKDLIGDYYITISTEKDIGILLGTFVKWEFLNGKMFIHPEPPQAMKIGIKFRSAVTIDEINTNYFIRKYALASAKEVLGTIRGTFGGTMPGGTEMLTLRGEALIAEGKEEKREIMEQMIKLSEPMGFIYG